MELACWWTDAVKKDFPLVLKYWETIKQRYSSLHQHINNELLISLYEVKSKILHVVIMNVYL